MGGKESLVPISVSFERLKELLVISESETLYKRLEDQAGQIKITRDPFSRVPVESSQGPVLMGIYWDKGQPIAIINDEIVKIGSFIYNYRVVDIKKTR